MKFMLEQVSPRLFFVVDTDGRRFSKKPMFRKRARLQQKALFASQEDERKMRKMTKVKGGAILDDPLLKGMTPGTINVDLSDPDLDPTQELEQMGLRTTAQISKRKMTRQQIFDSDLALLKNAIARNTEAKSGPASQARNTFIQEYEQAYTKGMKRFAKLSPEDLYEVPYQDTSILSQSEGGTGQMDPEAVAFNTALKETQEKTPRPAAAAEEDDSPSTGEQILGAMSTGFNIGKSILETIF